ncbi:hypothetical protein BU202_02435 [Streptococcus cuniculi]|uniref:Uncharacterized protein n=1 Tax=Streptococcus cuniculi TaxID=1432788 RepID=A0A1Q8E9M3_9STRE|nr:hypothetical protein [Streptococcus cuniculi]OLF48491.1 hypothetical protein BU202_02435 [Streptococcus cuniculi]
MTYEQEEQRKRRMIIALTLDALYLFGLFLFFQGNAGSGDASIGDGLAFLLIFLMPHLVVLVLGMATLLSVISSYHKWGLRFALIFHIMAMFATYSPLYIVTLPGLGIQSLILAVLVFSKKYREEEK